MSSSASNRSSIEVLTGWGSLFQQSSEAIFLLNRHRRIRFVNRAWETLTGLPSDQVLGLFCLPRKRKGDVLLKELAQTLAPNAEVMRGKAETVRRSCPVGSQITWWDISFFPLLDSSQMLGVLGKIQPVSFTVPISKSGWKILTDNIITLRERFARRFTLELLQSPLPNMQRVQGQARVAAQTRNPLWIIGPSGTGKETLARIIHFESSQREAGYVRIDCQGLKASLIRSQLFGHNGLTKGALPGTIYLKEPAFLTTEIQSQILDWYIEQDNPPRLILGSNRHPQEAIEAQKLLEDVWTVFGIQEIHLPPLQQRIEDLPRYLSTIVESLKKQEIAFPGFANEVLELFREYTWPNNLRELRAVVLEILQRVNGQRVELTDVPMLIRRAVMEQRFKGYQPVSSSSSMNLMDVLQSVEKKLIQTALNKAHGNKTEAAEKLGLDRTQLWRRLKALGLDESKDG